MKIRTLFKLFFGLLLAFFVSVACYYFYPYSEIPNGVVIDKIIVIKSKQILEAYSQGKLIVVYPVAIGKQAIGAKEIQDDQKTPEGEYTINDKNPNSGWHKNLGVSYPNDADRARAKQLGRPTGGDIKIHGLKNGDGRLGRFHRWKNWTNGCIALTDEEMDELYEHTPIGTPITIKP